MLNTSRSHLACALMAFGFVGSALAKSSGQHSAVRVRSAHLMEEAGARIRADIAAKGISIFQAGGLHLWRKTANREGRNDRSQLPGSPCVEDALRALGALVSGHGGCSSVVVAMEGPEQGLVDRWLGTVENEQDSFCPQPSVLDGVTRLNRLGDLNVIEQRDNPVEAFENAWKAGCRPMIHDWPFDQVSGFLGRRSGEINGESALHEGRKHQGDGSGAPL